MVRGLAGMLLVGVAMATAPAAETTSPREGADRMRGTSIVKEAHHGWPNTYRLSNASVEARVVTDVGPRIIDFRPIGGENVLYVRESEVGKQDEPEWVFRGGWRLWVAPEVKESTYALDNSPCRAEVVDASTLRVSGPPQPTAGIQKQIDVTLLPDEAHLHIVASIKNVSDHPVTYAAWSLPVLRPGGRAFVPLDKGSLTAFDAIRKLILWSYAEPGEPRYRFGDQLVEIDSSKVLPAPRAQSGRRDDESKIGVDSKQGWAAYLLGGTLFLKRFPYDVQGTYIDGGATIEVYSSHEFLELENLGPLTTLQPGDALVLPEDWWLFTGVSVPAQQPAALSTLQGYVSQTRAP